MRNPSGPTRRRWIYAGGALLSIIALMAIALTILKVNDRPTLHTPPPAPPRPTHEAETEYELLLRASQVEPTFAGAYVTDNGVMHIWLTEPSDERATRVQNTLAALDAQEHSSKSFVTHPARYGYRSLYRWYQRLAVLVREFPIASMSISFPDNRIEIGLDETAQPRKALLKRIDNLGVPLNAVRVRNRGPAQFPTASGENRPSR